MLHSGGCGLAPGDPQLPGRAPLVRCFGGALHFIAAQAACPAPAQLEQALGCVATSRSSNMPRALRACSAAAANGGRRYHVLDGACEAGDTDDYEGVIGFVH